MGLVELMFLMCLSAATVSAARLRRGPLRPTWSWGYEVVTCAQKRFHRRVARRSPATERRAWGALKGTGPVYSALSKRREALDGVPVAWLQAAGANDGESIVLYLHGGGFMYGSERSHGELSARLAHAAQARVAIVEYRLCPEHPFPAALEDTLGAYRALLHGGIDPRQIVVAGDSAGGNLALAAMIALRDAGEPLPAGGILLSPWVDLLADGGSMVENERYDWAERWMFRRWREAYLQGADAHDPMASPVRAALEGLPPLYIAVGTAEMLLDQVVTLAEKAKRAGVHVTLELAKDRVHNWLALAPMFPELQDGFGPLGQFVRDARLQFAPVDSSRSDEPG